MRHDLRPCPFCGGSVSIIYNSLDNAYAVYQDNANCPLVEPIYIDGNYAGSLKEAYDIWNKRM